MNFPSTLKLIYPIQPDALYFFQTRDFYNQNPNSLTSNLFKLIFKEDIKGVLVVLYKDQKVDILAIAESNFQKFLPFASSNIRVLQVKKGSDVPEGLSDVIAKLKLCSSVEFADNVQSNLTLKIRQQLDAINIPHSKAQIPQSFFTLPAELFPSMKQAVSEAQNTYQSMAEALTKKSPHLITDKITQGLETVEKSQAFTQFIPQDQNFSITTTLQEGILQKGLNVLRNGFSNVSEMQNTKFQAVQITVSSRKWLQLSLGRMIFVCKEEVKKLLQEKLDLVCKLHEMRIQAIISGQSVRQFTEASQEIVEASMLKFIDKMSTLAICATSQAGICTNDQLQQNAVDMTLDKSSAYVFNANTPILVRTSVMIDVSGNQCVCTLCDSVMPSESQVVQEKSLTSPLLTKSSVSEFLREYYVIKEIQSKTPSQQPQTAAKTSAPANTAQSFALQQTQIDNSSSNEQSDELSPLEKRRLKQKKQRELLDMHAGLKYLVKEQMQRRLPTQKLICDDEDAQEIKIAYKEVVDMPHGLAFQKNVFVSGEKLFFFINGRPVPILPEFFHSVFASGDERKIIRIKFIAPGQIVGKKEQHFQLDQYPDFTYLKEIVLETQNFGLASKIVERLEKVKQQVENQRKTQVADVYSFPEFDCDNQITPALKEYLTGQESYRALKSPQNQCAVGTSSMSQALEMRPKLRLMNTASGKRDQGDLSICDNGVKYRYASTGQQSIELFMPFRGIRRIFYEKFRDNQHVCVVSFLFYRPIRIEDALIDQNLKKNLQPDANFYERFSFLCSMETQLQLGMGRERDEMQQEQETRLQMKRSNVKFDEFFSKLSSQVQEYCNAVKDELPENPRPLICQLSKRSKSLQFLGSVEQKGQQQVFTYEPGFIGVFNSKVQRSIDMNDVQLAVLENVNYSTHNAFQIAFVYKDIRVEPYIIRQVQFDNISDIEEYLTINKVYYIEITDSFLWGEAKKRYNYSREEYNQFVENGGWIAELGDESQSEDESSAGDEEYKSEESSAYEDSEDGYSQSVSVESEEVKESDGDYSVYDWSRSDSD